MVITKRMIEAGIKSTTNMFDSKLTGKYAFVGCILPRKDFVGTYWIADHLWSYTLGLHIPCKYVDSNTYDGIHEIYEEIYDLKPGDMFHIIKDDEGIKPYCQNDVFIVMYISSDFGGYKYYVMNVLGKTYWGGPYPSRSELNDAFKGYTLEFVKATYTKKEE